MLWSRTVDQKTCGLAAMTVVCLKRNDKPAVPSVCCLCHGK